MSFAFPTKQLSDLAVEIDYGVTASASTLDTGTKFLRITDIQDRSVEWASVPFCEAPENKLRSARLEDGDIVFARTGATTGKSFLIKSPPDGAVFASYLIRVKPSRLVDPNYLAHFFQSSGYWGQIKRKTQGAAQGGVNASSLSELEIPLPPFDEQRRIAAILDKADDLRRKRKRALELLDGLTQSIFLEMFGDIESNPKGWRRGRIGDLLEDTQYGTSEKASEYGKYPILRMGNLTTDGRMDFGSLKYIDLDDRDIDKYTVRRGDILFNRTNSADLVGKTAVFDQDERFAFAGYLVRARVKNGVSPHYVSGYLNSRHGKATLRGMAKSIVGMANINAKEMQSIPILMPDAHTQRVFSEAIAKIASARDVGMHHLTLLDSAFSSLQSRAFSGQL